MSAKKTNISQIRKYLNGELDARAMHQLERKAQDDPFLMDALEGYEHVGKDQHANFVDLQERLAKRIAPKKERSIILWRVLPIAACLLIALIIGYWYFAPKPVKQYAAIIKPDKIVTSPVTPQPEAPQIAKQQDKVTTNSSNRTALRQNPPTPAAQQDVTVNASPVQAVTKARLNGKDFSGGDVKAAIKSLPADIVEKIQVVDDYGDQAAKTGVKPGDPTKSLNITMDTLKLIASNKPASPAGSVMIRGTKSAANELKEVSIKGYTTQNKRDVTASVSSVSSNPKDTILNQALSGRVTGMSVAKSKTNADGSRTITGKVVEKDNGSSLPGVSIRINGKAQGTQTNADGTFTITLPAKETLLDVAFVGYETQKIQVGNRDNLKIELTPDTHSLSEVVVVGYGSAKRSAVPYEAEHPLIGWIDYDKYLKENATITDGKPVSIQLTFSVSADGTVSNIKILKGNTDELNQRAVKLIENGSKWIGSTDGKTKLVKLNITFHKE